MNKKQKERLLVLVLIVLIWVIVNINMMGFISGVKGKENIALNQLEQSLETLYKNEFTYINRYALDEVIYVFESDDQYYYVSDDETVYLEEDVSCYDESYWSEQLKKENMLEGSIFLAFYKDDSAVVLEDDRYIKVYDLKSKTCYFSFMKRGNE